jgi:hypothetical protein
MDTGRLRLGIVMSGSWARATHEGRAGDGFENTEHRIDAGWVEWNLDAQLALDPRFAFDVALPVRLTVLDVAVAGPDEQSLPVADTIHRDQTVFGLGDLALGTRFGIVRDEDVRGWVLDARLGFSAPTGATQPSPYHPANPEGIELVSLGSGTVDPIVGFESTYNAGRWGLLAWSTARIPVVENRWDNRAGRTVQAAIGAFSGFGLVRWRFLAQPEIFYVSPVRWQDRDAPSSDRLSLLASVGAVVQPRPRMSVHFMLKVPYYTRTETGRDFLWPFVAVVGFNYTFELIPESDHHH